mgnify:CR=1 FL=1
MNEQAQNWTAERIETLAELWKDGLTAAEIAQALGGVSRSAVIGKASRLRLEARRAPALATTGESVKRRPWTEGEEALLRAAILEGLNARQVAERLDRTAAACDRQARNMGLKLTPVDRTDRSASPPARGRKRSARPQDSVSSGSGSRFRDGSARQPSARAPRMSAASIPPREGHEKDAGLSKARLAAAFALESAPPGARLIPFDALKRGQCRWPLGDDLPFTFCGADVAGPREVDAGSRTRTGAKRPESRPYCAHHRRVGTQSGVSPAEVGAGSTVRRRDNSRKVARP